MLRSQVRWIGGVLFAGLVIATSCRPEQGRTVVVSGGPPPIGDKAALLAYADSLPYWAQLGAADRRPVDPEGVLAKIEPENDAYLYSEAQIDSGRVIGRISKTEPVPLLRFGLGATDTVSYWMVFKKEDKYYGHFFSASGTADTTYQIEIEWHDGRGKVKYKDEAMKKQMPWGQSISQWRYIPDVAGAGSPEEFSGAVVGKTVAWTTCSPWGCCRGN